MAELIFVIIFVAIGLLWWSGARKPFTPPQTRAASPSVIQSFEAVPSLFVNGPEKAFFHAMQNHLPQGFAVMSKVRLEDIIRVKRAIKDPQQVWHLRGRVKSRHVDFLIIDHSGQPLVAIELDGRSHDDPSAANADALKDGLFDHAGLKLKRVRTGDDFDHFARRLSGYLSGLNLA